MRSVVQSEKARLAASGREIASVMKRIDYRIVYRSSISIKRERGARSANAADETNRHVHLRLWVPSVTPSVVFAASGSYEIQIQIQYSAVPPVDDPFVCV